MMKAWEGLSKIMAKPRLGIGSRLNRAMLLRNIKWESAINEDVGWGKTT